MEQTFRMILFSLAMIISTCSLASQTTQIPHKIKIHFNLDWHQTEKSPRNFFNNPPLHLEKIVHIDMQKHEYMIAYSMTKIVNTLPVTLVLLVKPLHTSTKTNELQFSLLQYGMDSQANVLWTQPHLKLTKGKTAEFKFPDGSLSLKAFEARR